MTQRFYFWEFILRNSKTLIQKNICIPMLIAVLFTMAKIWKQPKCPPVDEQIQLWYYLHNGITTWPLKKKKKEILPFATVWMDLENIMLSEISQAEKDKYHMISLVCGI